VVLENVINLDSFLGKGHIRGIEKDYGKYSYPVFYFFYHVFGFKKMFYNLDFKDLWQNFNYLDKSFFSLNDNQNL